MNSPQSNVAKFVLSYGPLFGVTGLATGFLCAYVLFNVAPSPIAELIAAYLIPISFATWIQAHAHTRRCTPCYDFGMFVLATWIVSVPAYLIYTRGRRGILLTAMFAGLLFTPYLVATAVWMICYQFPN